MWIERDYSSRIIEAVKSRPVVLLTGICQAGKSSLLNIDSLETLENSIHLGSFWENFVLSEYIKDGFNPGKDIFYYRDTNGVEIDFVIEKGGEIFLVEAKHSERPNPKKLNFRKIAPLFSEKVNPLLACTIKEKGLITLRDYAVYNPLFVSIL